MNEQDIDKLEAGPYLDALIASLVLKQGEYVQHMTGTGFIQHVIRIPDGHLVFPANHSTDIAAAWSVVEKMIDVNNVELSWYNSATGWIWRFRIIRVWAADKTAPLAICKAALKAVMVEHAQQIDR